MRCLNRQPKSQLWGPAVVLVCFGALACGRTDAQWWADLYASDTGTDEAIGDGDGDGDGDDDAESDTSTDTAWDTSDTDPSDTDPDTGPTTTTDTGETDTTETETDTTTGCEDVPVALSPSPATVVFLLDQGAHMSLDYAGMTRWEAIGEALFSIQQGVVWSWEDQRELGLVSFTSFNGNQGGMCPILATVAPLLGNGAAMDLAFAGQNPADDNPVADAITASVPLFAGEPGHLLLLTGRNPDTCTTQNPQQSAAAAVLAAQDAFAAGVWTHVVEVGQINASYAQSLANAGVGLDPQGQVDAPYSEPGNADALTQALDALLAGIVDCELTLDQALAPGGELECTLELDGMPLGLNDPDGWSVAAPDRVVLGGSACTSLSQAATPTMLCTCDAF
ncbi:hypothetical protein [Enhygromyxa salina]|uniref:VWFA domain-containing protein n=1 Tax=Enhygromyxa salina TaxID=215803 RepID=A0A2S9YFK0_9BACT|nr:hypothetical protein [Enhygromyxa salina]PRQ03812.1 hypothetical protein ENSA7_52790 [Enhygromyxa salina]